MKKQFLLSVMVLLMAIGAAFANNATKTLDDFVYIRNQFGDYYLFSTNGTLPSTGYCSATTGVRPCYVSYSTSYGGIIDKSTPLPSGGTPSTTIGYWHP